MVLRFAPSRRPLTVAVPLLGAVLAASCVGERELVITSIPEGAVVRLDDRIVGLTPLEVPFRHYGTRRISVYREGYRTFSEPLKLRAPWYARFPMDILTEVILPLGIDDVREINVDLVADTGDEAKTATDEFAEHAAKARRGESLMGEPIAGAPEDDEETGEPR